MYVLKFNRTVYNETWTEEKVQKLIDLWAAKEPAGVIANILGVSRNAVIGKVHRLGLPGRESPLSYNNTVTNLSKKTSHKRELKTLGKIPAPKVGAVRLENLKYGRCAFPFGDSAPYLFCGKKAVRGPYCECHAKICYKEREKK